ncbi:MAG TPA: malate dehydrogenase, partial [Alcanivorax sp.]|nr:malate dehydrogenase [Alcanivorax sp.]
IDTVVRIHRTFGGINLEDIRAPECFEIERVLKELCDVPVFHDDQHGTAIVVGAGLLNALEIQKKRIQDIKVVCVGAGAAGVASVRLLIEMGARKENILVLDRKGVIHSRRDDLNQYKAALANDTDKRTLDDAVEGADVFIGVSGPDMLTPEMVKKMADKPIIFALANPDPEIRPEVAKSVRSDAIIATGRSDYPNQVNNVLCFPYMFRGALDVRSTSINEEMKLAAVHAIAELVREAPPKEVLDAYGGEPLNFGPEYIIPKPNDPRLLGRVSAAVANAAVESGVARKGYPSHYPLNSLDEIFPEL